MSTGPLNLFDLTKQIQTAVGVPSDGLWGIRTAAMVLHRLNPTAPDGTLHSGYATSFADPADVAAFRECKTHGVSDKACFKVGDNAIGCWGDSTAEGTGPSCAVPPEDMREKWGSMAEARHKPVKVVTNGRTAFCILKDTMPHRSAITNRAVIDLNPDACRALGLTPPVKTLAQWSWAV